MLTEEKNQKILDIFTQKAREQERAKHKVFESRYDSKVMDSERIYLEKWIFYFENVFCSIIGNDGTVLCERLCRGEKIANAAEWIRDTLLNEKYNAQEVGLMADAIPKYFSAHEALDIAEIIFEKTPFSAINTFKKVGNRNALQVIQKKMEENESRLITKKGDVQLKNSIRRELEKALLSIEKKLSKGE